MSSDDPLFCNFLVLNPSFALSSRFGHTLLFYGPDHADKYTVGSAAMHMAACLSQPFVAVASGWGATIDLPTTHRLNAPITFCDPHGKPDPNFGVKGSSVHT